MSLKPVLGAIVALLRNHIQVGTLDAHAVQTATTELAKHHYKYDADLFPPLPSNNHWPAPTLAAPQSLAEALLWKMGKWQIYKSFVAHYSSTSSTPKNTDTVFYAFAKHLQNPARPIYDQHALRALWAIDTKLTPQQAKICRNLLAKKDGTWKSIITGSNTSAGYDLYAERIVDLEKGGASLSALDKLLMPLGQALKGNTVNVSEFVKLAGCGE
ncbi:hypothetical protein [Pseudomonas delhiensis]|uniref:hypothetical protein n=1 Tax=Pseudomonas delhiensis TaxID=366289 RepID=UPI00315A34D9